MRQTMRAACLALAVLLAACVPKAQDRAQTCGTSFVFIDPAELDRSRELVRSGELARALTALRNECDWAVLQPPYSVVWPGKATAAGVGPNDYVSLSPSWWPDPEKPGGLPYVQRPGRHNPDAVTRERKALESACDRIYGLSLGYALTGEKAYALHAAKLLRVFFLHKDTAMTPNMNHARMIPGRNTGSPDGLVEGRPLLRLLDAPGLLGGSGALKPSEEKGFRAWCSRYLDWLLSSPAGREAADLRSPQGLWCDVQVTALAQYTGRGREAARTLARASDRLESESALDDFACERKTGLKHLGERLERLEAWSLYALVARKAGVDLWALRSPSGRSLRRGVDAMLPCLREVGRLDSAQAQELSSASMRRIALLLRLSAWAYAQPGYEKDMEDIVGPIASGLRLNLAFPPGRESEK